MSASASTIPPHPVNARAATRAPFALAGQSVVRRRRIVCGTLALILLGSVIVSAAHGAAAIPYGDVAQLLLRGLGLPVGLSLPQSDFTIIWTIRLPRILIGALVGAALAGSGATLQGLFRNPLADPGLLGVGAGGALAAVIAITSGLAAVSLWTLPAFAFVGALSAAALIYTLAVVRGRADSMTLLLAGIAVNAFLGAVISALELLTRDYNAIMAILGWLVGGLSGRGWEHLAVAVLPVSVGLIGVFVYSRDLNLLWAGEDTAQSLGVDVPRVRLILLVLTALMTGAAVSIAGGIGFVGLIVPHALRLIVGPDYRVLLPASALGGAVFLTLADTISRLLIQPVELQVGIVTALCGAPFFLFLLWRQRPAIALQSF
ncbi:MAG: FecCD family ABC transporter permease [Aggregatilineales bacterium]